MLVRSRYEFEAVMQATGLSIQGVHAFSFFSNDPMGLDGPDDAGRGHFNQVRAAMNHLLASDLSDEQRTFFVTMFVEIERATLAYARERVAETDLPSQKLVVLRRD